jgi:hypothetical protein
MIELIKCGSLILTKTGNIKATITGITIRFDAVAYEIGYFNGAGERKEVWLNESEFNVINGDRVTIGFNSFQKEVFK